jgi:DNA-damage-inducible protein J
MSTIQVRVKDSTKKSAKKILDKLGIDMSSAIKIYLHQIVITKGIPFNLVTENGLTIDEEEEILKASEEAKQGKNVVRTTTWKETKAFLDSLK